MLDDDTPCCRGRGAILCCVPAAYVFFKTGKYTIIHGVAAMHSCTMYFDVSLNNVLHPRYYIIISSSYLLLLL